MADGGLDASLRAERARREAEKASHERWAAERSAAGDRFRAASKAFVARARQLGIEPESLGRPMEFVQVSVPAGLFKKRTETRSVPVGPEQFGWLIGYSSAGTEYDASYTHLLTDGSCQYNGKDHFPTDAAGANHLIGLMAKFLADHE